MATTTTVGKQNEPRSLIRERRAASHASRADSTGDDHDPLAGYAILIGVFVSAAAAFAWMRRAQIQRSTLSARDIALLGAGTCTAARILTRDRVTAPIREPFVQNRKPIGHGEVEEDARGHGLRRAIGELVTCPFCVTPWVAGAVTALHITRPELARSVASLLAIIGVADVLQLAHEKLTRVGNQ